MQAILTDPNLLGFSISENSLVSTYDDHHNNNNNNTKIVIIQTLQVTDEYYNISMDNRFYNYFNYNDPVNDVFQNHLTSLVYDYIITIPFLVFFNLTSCVLRLDDFVAWKFPVDIQNYFELHFRMTPYFRDYFMLSSYSDPSDYLSISAVELIDIQLQYFHPGHDFNSYKWLSFKTYPLEKSIFPITISHSGNLFASNFLHSINSNFFNSHVIGVVRMRDGQFDIVFNPTVLIPYTEHLHTPQRFFFLGADNRSVHVHTKYSRIWFELLFF